MSWWSWWSWWSRAPSVVVHVLTTPHHHQYLVRSATSQRSPLTPYAALLLDGQVWLLGRRGGHAAEGHPERGNHAPNVRVPRGGGRFQVEHSRVEPSPGGRDLHRPQPRPRWRPLRVATVCGRCQPKAGCGGAEEGEERRKRRRRRRRRRKRKRRRRRKRRRA